MIGRLEEAGFLVYNVTIDGAHLIALADERRNSKLLGGEHTDESKSLGDKCSKTKCFEANVTRPSGSLQKLIPLFPFL